MKILVDIFGSDDDICVPITAACNMANKITEKIVLVGRKSDILNCINTNFKNEYENIINHIEILDAKDYITNNEEPAWAIKNKKDSSIVVAYNYMKTHDDTVFISAGSTGAIMAGALLKIGRINKIHRPALVTILPTIKDKKTVLLDSGANPQAKDISIIQYATLGKIYSKYILKQENPAVYLLNIGTEEEKGTPELKEIHSYLKQNLDNFKGNIEAREILSGKADVIVCDGLLGNIALKAIEGTAKTMKSVMSNAFKTNPLNMLKGIIAKNTLSNSLKKYDYRVHGGAVLLGVNKPVIKVHGSSNVQSFEKAILQAKYMLENRIIDRIKENI